MNILFCALDQLLSKILLDRFRGFCRTLRQLRAVIFSDNANKKIIDTDGTLCRGNLANGQPYRLQQLRQNLADTRSTKANAYFSDGRVPFTHWPALHLVTHEASSRRLVFVAIRAADRRRKMEDKHHGASTHV